MLVAQSFYISISVYYVDYHANYEQVSPETDAQRYIFGKDCIIIDCHQFAYNEPSVETA